MPQLSSKLYIVTTCKLILHGPPKFVYKVTTFIYIYCILRGQIKGFKCSITTILFEVGSYRTVVGYSYRTLLIE